MGRISVDKSLIKDLSDLLEENNLSEISVTQGRQSIKVTRNILSKLSEDEATAIANANAKKIYKVSL